MGPCVRASVRACTYARVPGYTRASRAQRDSRTQLLRGGFLTRVNAFFRFPCGGGFLARFCFGRRGRTKGCQGR
eukprot:12721449-Alexandrium_andersonii.AAC.1